MDQSSGRNIWKSPPEGNFSDFGQQVPKTKQECPNAEVAEKGIHPNPEYINTPYFKQKSSRRGEIFRDTPKIHQALLSCDSSSYSASTAQIQTPHSPPIGCSRTTPILNQRFGPMFNRRYTMPHGAPYPLRPSPEKIGSRRAASLLSKIAQHNYQYETEPSVFQFAHPQPNSSQFPAPPQLVSSPLLYPDQASTFKTFAISSISYANDDVDYDRQHNINAVVAPPLYLPDSELINPVKLPFVWKAVHHKQEESINSQLAAKSMELAEFQKAFCNDTPVRDVLASGWFKKQVLEKQETSTVTPFNQAINRPFQKKLTLVQRIPLNQNTQEMKHPQHDTNAIVLPPTQDHFSRHRKPNSLIWRNNKLSSDGKLTSQEHHSRLLAANRKSTAENRNQQLSRVSPKLDNQTRHYDVLSRHLSTEFPKEVQTIEHQVVNCQLVNQTATFSENLTYTQDSTSINKEQFSKEVVKQAQQMQQQAQQGVLQRQGMKTSCITDPRYHEDNPKQWKTCFLDETMHQNRMGVQHTTGSKPSTPNILKKNRSSEMAADCRAKTELEFSDPLQPPQPEPIFVSKLPTSFSSNCAPIPDSESKSQPRDISDSPRKRLRKQILTQDDYDPPSSKVPTCFPEKIKEQLIEETIRNVLTDVKNASSSMKKTIICKEVKFEEESVKNPIKKVRGRPKKEKEAVHPKADQLRVRKPKMPALKSNDLITNSINFGLHDEMDEKERIALIQGLPTNLLDAIKAQKAIEKKLIKNPKRTVRKLKTVKKEEQLSSFAGEQVTMKDHQQDHSSLTDSLHFLQSLATMDTQTLLFGGNNLSQLIDIDAESGSTCFSEELSGSFPNQREIFSYDEENSLPPPTATAVATSGQPLVLDFQSPPMLIQAHIWTNESGPLVPFSLYQDSLKDQPSLHVNETPAVDEANVLSQTLNSASSRSTDCDVFFDANKFHGLSNSPIPWIQNAPVCRSKPIALELGIRKPERVRGEWAPGTSVLLSRKEYKSKSASSTCRTISQQLKKALRRIGSFYGWRRRKTFSLLRKLPRKKDKEVLEENLEKLTNEMWDDMINNFCSMKLVQTHYHISLEINGTSTQFDINWDSTDFTNKWLPWHQKTVNHILAQAKNKLLTQKTSHLLPIIETLSIMLSHSRNARERKMLTRMVAVTKGMCSRLAEKLEKVHIFSDVSLSKTFKIKKDALEARLLHRLEHKETYGTNVLKSVLDEWKIVVNDYNSTTCDMEKGHREKKLKTSWYNLRKALDYHDALIDVVVFSSRLHVLYSHAVESLPCSKLNSYETRELLLSIEDTEHLLMLAEIKVKLMETPSPRNNDRITLINLYFFADDFNIAKCIVKRTGNSRNSEEYEKNLHLKVERFSFECKRAGLSAIIDKLPTNWNFQIRNEEEQRKKNGKKIRTNIFFTGKDFGQEIGVKLLSSSTLRKTCPEMWFTAAQTTTMVDEQLKINGELEKKLSRAELQDVIPMFREDSMALAKQFQVYSQTMRIEETGHWMNLKLAEAVALKADHVLETIKKEVEKHEESFEKNGNNDYYPGKNTVDEVPCDIRFACEKFRRMKEDQANHRKEEKWHKEVQKINKSVIIEHLSNERENMLDEIRKTNAIIQKTDDPVRKKKCENLLEKQLVHYRRVQKEEREQRFSNGELMQSLEKSIMVDTNGILEDVLDDLEMTIKLSTKEEEQRAEENHTYRTEHMIVRQRFGEKEIFLE